MIKFERRDLILLGVFAIVIAALAISLTLGIQGIRERADLRRELKAISQRKAQVIDADSLRDIIEHHVKDSFNTVIDAQDRKIAASLKRIESSNKKINELEKDLHNLNVAMPDF